MHDHLQILEDHAMRRPERPRKQRCARCGGQLDLKRALIAVNPALCVDCAFEDAPHAD